jgi:hypothetical protein
VKEISLAEGQFLGGPFGGVIVEGFDYLERKERNGVSHRECADRQRPKRGSLTFLGGKIAMADLGVMEMW